MEYIIKVSHGNHSIIIIKDSFPDTVKIAHEYIKDGFAIDECYGKEGITKMKEEIYKGIPKNVFPEVGIYNSVLLTEVKASLDAKNVIEKVKKTLLSQGLASVVTKYSSILEDNPELHHFFLYVENGIEKVLVSLAPTKFLQFEENAPTGFSVSILAEGLKDAIKDSGCESITKKFSLKEDRYILDCGSDCQKAILAITEIVRDVYNLEVKDIILRMTGYSNSDFAVYNGYGEKTGAAGEGIDDFKDISNILEQSQAIESDISIPTKKGCYIATAIYGSYDCPEVWTLRRFRDNYLERSVSGRLFIRFYYTVSPTLVKCFGGTAWFNILWRHSLDRLVKNLNSHGIENTAYVDKEI